MMVLARAERMNIKLPTLGSSTRLSYYHAAFIWKHYYAHTFTTHL